MSYGPKCAASANVEEDIVRSRGMGNRGESDKGYIQLAIRSGQYRKLNVLEIKEGELIRFSPLEEDLEVRLIQDEGEREAAPTVGYYAMFEYINGFRKAIYWSREQMEAHAFRYSKSYQKKNGKSFWEKDFDAMGKKTMLRQLISKWGIMSAELQTALEKDEGAILDSFQAEYVDNEEAPPIEAEPVPQGEDAGAEQSPFED